MNNYIHTLKEHHLKATPQRLEIISVLEQYGHITIEALYKMMIKKFSSISLATIYKNINLMLESSLMQEVKIPHAKSVYELTKASHSHLVCNSCNNIYDVTIVLDDIVEIASKSTKFKIDKTDIVFSGVCRSCQV